MQVYKYKGYDITGKKVEGEVTAASVDEVERKVASQAVTIIAIIPAGAAKKSGSLFGASTESTSPRGVKRLSEADMANLLNDLAVMAETGVPFVEALDAVIITARTPSIALGLKALKAEVIGGKSLSAAMKSSALFPTIVSDMIKVAEEGGRLDKALSSASIYVHRAADLKKKVMNAMLYPIVLTVIAFATLTVMITFVLPRFAGIFATMKTEVPAITKFLLGLGQSIKGTPHYWIGGMVAIFILTKVAWKNEKSKRVISIGLLRVPILGELLRRLALSRALQSISTLLSSNVSLMQALEHGANVSGNPVIQEAIMTSRSNVEHGISLSEAMKDTKAFPTTLIQMVSVGERTGRLAMLMSTSANNMENDVDGRLKALISIVEPVMIVVMGGIVGVITLSIIIPMYSIVENIK